MDSPQFKKIRKTFDIIIHFSPENVVKLRAYRSLVSSLNSQKHLFLNERNEYETNHHDNIIDPLNWIQLMVWFYSVGLHA